MSGYQTGSTGRGTLPPTTGDECCSKSLSTNLACEMIHGDVFTYTTVQESGSGPVCPDDSKQYHNSVCENNANKLQPN